MIIYKFKGNFIFKFLPVITIIFYSWTDKDSHKSTTYIINNSGSKIEFTIFRNGERVDIQTKKINVDERVSIFA